MSLTPCVTEKICRTTISNINVEFVIQDVMISRLIASKYLKRIKSNGVFGFVARIYGNVYIVLKANRLDFSRFIFETIINAIIGKGICQLETG